ncbi:MAG: hypothetical protein H5T65_12995, partial [Chloroflexi bacterium]|nr:hypothetical protein [Chloroflexota bacterium]
MNRKIVFYTLLLWAILMFVAGAAHAQQPVVRALFFYSPTCPHCEAVIKEYIPSLLQKYGKQLEIAFIDISNPQNYEGLLRLEAAYGLDSTKTGVPEVFIGDKVLTGEVAIRGQMESIIQEYLAKGGVDYPALARINPEGTPAPTPTPNAPAKPIALAYFYKPGCQECNRVEYDLRLLESRVPGLKVYR